MAITTTIETANSLSTSLTTTDIQQYSVSKKDDVFQVYKTSKKVWRVVYIILSVIIPILGLARLSAFLISRFLIGKHMVHGKKEKDSFYQSYQEKANYQRINVKTVDGAKLDGFCVYNKHQTDKWLIYYPQIGTSYEESFTKMEDLINRTGRNVLICNLRGAGHSSKKTLCKDHLLLDAEAMVQTLRQMGIPYENIALEGHSLGGGIATIIAAKHHARNEPIRLVTNGAFRNLTAAFKGMLTVHGDDDGPPCFMRKVVAPVVLIFMKVLNWNLNPAKYLNQLDKNKVFIIMAQEDDNIGNDARLRLAGCEHIVRSEGHVCHLHGDQLSSYQDFLA